MLHRDLLAGLGKPPAPGFWTIAGSSLTQNVLSNTQINFPPGYAAGDAVIAILARDSTATFPDGPGGSWQLINVWGSGPGFVAYLLPGIGAETGIQFTTQSASNCSVALVVLRPTNIPVAGMYAGLILESAVAGGGGTTGVPNPPELVTTTDRNLIFAFGANRADNTTYTGIPAGFVAVVNTSGTAAVSVVLAVSTELQEAAGSIDPTAFLFANSNWSAMTFSLRTKIQPGLVVFSGAFATGHSNIPAGGEVVASASSVTVTIEGGSPLPISIGGGNAAQYRINGGSWTSAAGTISNGDALEVRQTSVAVASPGGSTTHIATVTIGSFSIPYSLISRRELVVVGATEYLTVPAGVTAMSITGTGGGGGAGGNYITSPYRGGGGGGGAAMSITPSLAVSAGQVLEITAGVGGAGGLVGGSNAVAGGDSFVVRSGSTLWRAKGGGPGGNASSGSNGSGGTGGSASSGIGTTRYSGGNGGNGAGSTTNISHTFQGGGGGAGGYAGNGSAGANGITSLTRLNSSAGSGGASSGGSSACGGGGTGVSGQGANGSASNSSGGREGSADAYATDGVINGVGGTSGGGGGITQNSNTGFRGGHGVVRLTW